MPFARESPLLSEQTLVKIGIICTGAISGLLLYSAISSAASSSSTQSGRHKSKRPSSSTGNPFNQASAPHANPSANDLGNLENLLLAPGPGSSSTAGFSVSQRQRPRAAGGGTRRPILTPESLQLPDISIETAVNEAFAPEVEVFAVDESDNLLNLIMSIAEEQTLSGNYQCRIIFKISRLCPLSLTTNLLLMEM